MVLIHSHAKKNLKSIGLARQMLLRCRLHIDLRSFLRAFISPDPKVK
ncbi:hypothetical protein SRABI111_00682 [Pseudomonas carnis]|nr:hypothetical protein SRABI08_00439 [Pseudomonas carnis]CAH0150019.1 hypothetical protein SRABI111_00682 [Pseudomonas carnis]CAH0222984.1 hypothetical protein SRABI110_02530 [Pseudomonas carnis]